MWPVSRHSVRADAPLVGWVQATGSPVLLPHGGPGFFYRYMDALASELGAGYQIACYQQRGLAPSSTEGPFTVESAVAEATAFL